MCYLYPDCDNILWLCIVTRCNRGPEICRNNVVQSVIKTSQILGHKLTFYLDLLVCSNTLILFAWALSGLVVPNRVRSISLFNNKLLCL